MQKNGQRPGQVNPKKAGHTALPACRINGFSTFLLLFAYSYIFSVQYLWEPDLMDDETMAPGTEAAVERFHALSGELRETEAALEKTAL